MRLTLKTVACVALLLLLISGGWSKDKPGLVLTWPSETQPAVRLTFGKFQELSALSGQRNFKVDIVAENLWGKSIDRASFSVYMFDKNQVRIGDGYIDLSDLPAGQSTRFTMNFAALGTPVLVRLVPKQLPTELQAYAPPKTVSITVYSVPAGAAVAADGKPAGTTPVVVQLATGAHKLLFTKEGFAPGTYPIQITGEEGVGGAVTYELGSSGHDTLELRDGTVVSGDLQSMPPTEVIVTIGGKPQSFGRNQVKKILLTQREPVSQ